MRLLFLTAVSLAFATSGTSVQAQTTTDSANVQFARARRLVSDGNGALGRALVDTLLAAATPGTPGYAEALYWRATLAERSGDAERDYRQLAVEYPTSPRSADALVRLAQLDLVRGQPTVARDHLARLLRDHADAPTRARAHYWLARASLDAGDTRAACTALNDAASETQAEGDLTRQLAALRTRVPRCGANTVAAAPVGRDSGPGTRGSASASRAPNPVPAEAAIRPPSSVPAKVETRAPTTPTGRIFTVQISAYETRGDADALAARLVKRGLNARVTSGGATPDAPPFRVRIGRYPTRVEAVAAQKSLKGKGLAGFVAEEAPNAGAPNGEPHP